MPNNNPHGGTHWSDDHVAELIRLAGEGVSYRGISKAINAKFGTNYTKSAVIGRASRMRLTKAAASSAPLTPRPRKEQRRVITFGNAKATRVYSSVQTAQYKLRCVEIVPRNLSLTELEPNDCRYPYGDGPMLFCGHPKMAGSSYCTSHHFLCWEPPRRLVDKRFARAA